MSKLNMKRQQNQQKYFFIFLFTFLILPGLMFAQQRAQRELKALGDTLFKSMNIEELKQIQKEYKARIKDIGAKEEKTRDRGLEVTEEFLAREGSNIKDQDKILIRLAEYYYDQADEEYFKKNEDYDKKYDEYLKELDEYYNKQREQEPVAPPQPKYDYSKVIDIYDNTYRISQQ